MPTLYDNFERVKNYIDENAGGDLSNYVSYSYLASKEYVSSPNLISMDVTAGILTDNGDGTYAINNMASKSYVADYVATYGGGGSTVIDENIIPKENNTYTLGDENHFYNAAYTYSISLSPKPYTKLHDGPVIIKSNSGLGITSSQIYIKFGGDGADTTYTYYVINKDYCGPWSNKSIDFGNKKNRWNAFNARAAYAYNMYVGWPEQNIYDVFPTYSYVADYVATYAPTPDLSTYVTEAELSGMSYATQTYVADYVATYGGGSGGGDVTKSDLAFIPYKYGNHTAYVSSYTYNASGSPYLSGTVVLNKGNGLVLGGKNAQVAGEYAISNGDNAYACADNSIALGRNTYTYGWSSFGTGRDCTTYNYAEFACGGANFSSSASYTSAHAAYGPGNSNSALETVFSVGIGVQQNTSTGNPNRIYARNAIEARWNGDFYVKGIGNYNGQNGSAASTYSLQYIINNLFSYDSSTGTLTISTL